MKCLIQNKSIMKKFLILFFVLILTSCINTSEITYEVKFKDGTITYANGHELYVSKKQGVVEIWSENGGSYFNYDDIISVTPKDINNNIKTNNYGRENYRSN